MTATTRPPVPAADLHTAFLRQLPRIYTHARYAFRHVACADSRDDRVAETVLAVTVGAALVSREIRLGLARRRPWRRPAYR
ncbi:MAG TPA: hypothetical protein VM533_06670 [Fimbriiglobus sp.]|jgi:hypothetical protein|nr:hypothetical protein [Fimbriiglobus sp.]